MTQTTLTLEQALAEIARLNSQAASRGARRERGSVTITDKGNISLNTGDGWPVTMKASKWALVFEKQEDIKAAIQRQLGV